MKLNNKIQWPCNFEEFSSQFDLVSNQFEFLLWNSKKNLYLNFNSDVKIVLYFVCNGEWFFQKQFWKILGKIRPNSNFFVSLLWKLQKICFFGLNLVRIRVNMCGDSSFERFEKIQAISSKIRPVFIVKLFEFGLSLLDLAK